MVRYGLTPPVKRPDLKYAPLPSYLRGGVYTPPPYPYTMKEGATGKKVGGERGRYALESWSVKKTVKTVKHRVRY